MTVEKTVVSPQGFTLSHWNRYGSSLSPHFHQTLRSNIRLQPKDCQDSSARVLNGAMLTNSLQPLFKAHSSPYAPPSRVCPCGWKFYDCTYLKVFLVLPQLVPKLQCCRGVFNISIKIVLLMLCCKSITNKSPFYIFIIDYISAAAI